MRIRTFSSSILLISVLALAGCGGEDSAAKKSFVAACASAVTSLDCDCFYDKVEGVLASGNTPQLLAFLKNKGKYSAKQQKARLTQIVGSENVTTIWRSSVSCSG